MKHLLLSSLLVFSVTSVHPMNSTHVGRETSTVCIASNCSQVAINESNGRRRKWAYVCKQCNAQVQDIVRHRRSHTDERPYSCSVCNQAFRESAVCKNHIMSQHSDSADAIVIVNLVNRKPYELVLKKRKTITHVNQLPKLSQELLAHSETQDSNFTKQSTESFFGIDENNFQEPYGYSLSLLDATKL